MKTRMTRYVWILGCWLPFWSGCGAPEAEFSLNGLYRLKLEREGKVTLTQQQTRDVNDILVALFGTPDDPYLPQGTDTGIEQLIRLDHLKLAAGRVGTSPLGPTGLYRQHCVHCHGISGDGEGPTAAFLNPYPRDYRRGIFKFKSTPIGVRPTHDDLKRVILHGVAGTAMPSFKLLPDPEVEALVDYVKYLSIRGEVERRLWEELALELDEGDRLIDPDDVSSTTDFLVDDVLAEIVGPWNDAASQITPVPQRPAMNDEEMLVSIRKGQELYYGAVANCVKCHGDSQLGDGQTTDYDEWTKAFFDWTRVHNAEWETNYHEFVTLTGLKPRPILPRNLRQGVFRGGRRPIDVYWRLHNGIEGSPMPAASMKPEGAPADTQGLTDEDVWHLVNYVMALPYETMTTQVSDEPVFLRPRQ